MRAWFLTQNALWGSGSARHLVPTPRIGLKFGRVLACRTKTQLGTVAWGTRDASRPETGPFRATSARLSRLADSGFRAAESRFLGHKATYRTAPKLEFQ